jgi:diphthine-ammonia ligase
MSAAGCDSRIIKVASGGMPEDLLGLNVADSRTMNRMIVNMAPFFEDSEFALRGAVLGEGGEFETLALDGPRSVWKRRIEITEEENLVVSEEGGVKWLKLGQSRAVQQETKVEDDQSSTDLVRVPGTFDPQFEHIAALRLKVEDHAELVPESITQITAGTTLSHEVLDCVTAKLSLESETLVIANITAPGVESDGAQQMEQIVSSLKQILLHISKANNIDLPLSSASIISTTLLLKSMSSFPSVNNSYARLFPIGLPNPPARVTIACSLPPHILVILSCTISLRPRSTHRGLHVQSRSYWAPANIGPYSQAICVPFNSDNEGGCEFVYMAGQIPLLPASMELFQAPFADQALLALQHLWRAGQERGVDIWTWGVALLPRLAVVATKEQPHIAAEVWKQAHLTTVHGKSVLGESEDGEDEDESGPDAWDLKYGRMRTARVRPSVGLHRHVLPNSAVIVNERDRLLIPSIIVAEVEELPRSASIEWHSHGVGGLQSRPRSKSGVYVEFSEFPWGMVSVFSYRISIRSYSCKDDSDGEDQSTSQNERRDHHFVTILVSQAAMVGDKTKVPPVSEVLECVLPARSSVLPTKAEGEKKIAQATDAGDRLALVHGVAYIAGVHGGAAFVALGGSESLPGITLIPCRRLWGKCYQVGTSGQKEGGIVGLTMALTLRIDTFAESG